MLRPRRLVSLLSIVLLTGALAACGGEKQVGYGDTTVSGFSGVSVTGPFGKKPALHWHSEIAAPDAPEVRTLIHGTGAKIGAGDAVDAAVYVGDATTEAKKWAYTSPGGSEKISASDNALFRSVLEGQRYGSRVEALVKSSDVFGRAGRPDRGIGTQDTLVLVFDLKSKAYTPDTTVHDVAPSAMPSVVERGGRPVRLDFSGVKKPPVRGKLYRTTLTKGTGRTVAADDTVRARYLGQVYGASRPFDANWSGSGFTADLAGGVIQGWSLGLAGTKVGSRVLLQIPRDLGYGAQGQPPAIKGTDTMYFVIEILSAK